MGPAPMIRMVEMSVLLGIKSRGNRKLGTKKGRAYRASLEPKRQVALARGVVFRPDSAAAKGFYKAHQPAFGVFEPMEPVSASYGGQGGATGVLAWLSA